MKKLFEEHLKLRLKQTFEIMLKSSVDNLFIESGFPDYYYLDDQPTAFRPTSFFQFFCPDDGQGHILHLSPDKKPKLYFYIPDDIWHETSSLNGEFWEDSFDIEIVNDHNACVSKLSPKGASILISPQDNFIKQHECLSFSGTFKAQMDWIRGSKSSYEIECLRLANEKACLGHRAAQKAFLAGKSELGIYEDYLKASGQRESDLPYGAIIGLNEKSAVLHYQYLRKEGSGDNFLIDAGAKHNGYCSDITRTYCTERAHPLFKKLLGRIETLQLQLCKMVMPGVEYKDIHIATMEGVSQIACDLGLLNCDLKTAIDNNLSDYFFPHGVGHPLGLQVHDVGARQTDSRGTEGSINTKYPYLRTLRAVQNNDVLTIEPGFYFIPKHLAKAKSSTELQGFFNWNLIEELIPFGGIRIEDNIVATKVGPTNLTREFL